MISLFILHCHILLGQNLVVNSSFDTVHECPNNLYGAVVNAKYWFNPTMGTPDLFGECAKGTEFYTIKNDCGEILNHGSDTSFAGIIVYTKDKYDFYKEYIGSSLKESLQKDSFYRIKARLCLAQVSKYTLQSIGITFLKNSKELNKEWLWTTGNLELNYIEILNKPIEKRCYWNSVETVFKAQGGESVFILGNFQKFDKIQSNKVNDCVKTISNRVKNQCYIYIDDIQIEKISGQSQN